MLEIGYVEDENRGNNDDDEEQRNGVEEWL